MPYGEVRSWAEQLPVGALFDLDEIQEVFPDKSREAIKMALGRLRNGDDPLVARVVHGVYCRRRLGSRARTPIPVEARRALPWRIAGPGAGSTGPDVINMFGWSTQVSPRQWIAVVGRPPQFDGYGVVFKGRSNERRLGLSWQEVSLLEAVRVFDTWAESEWEEALAKFGSYMAQGYYGVGVRSGVLLEAAAAERGLGPAFLPRCQDLAVVAGQTLNSANAA